MKQYLQRTWAEINLDALRHNFSAICSAIKPTCQAMPVIKADAYGHGAVVCAKELIEAGASCFAVSNLEEALQLRQNGIEQPLLILAYTPPSEAVRLAQYHITQTVVSYEYAKALSDAAKQENVTVTIHVKLDTGMSRVGFFYHDENRDSSVLQDIATACSLPGLYAEGIFTHFSSADEEQGNNHTKKQYMLFTHAIEQLHHQGVTFSLHHCCNSAAIMMYQDYQYEMVRPGIILYGLLPDHSWMKNNLDLQPVMQLKSVISLCKTVPANTTVNYGRTYVTERQTILATVPIGYADGYPRSMGNHAYMLVCGKRVPVVGRICMDQCVIDVTDVPDVKEGMTVTVFGTDGEETISVDELAQIHNTINYEMVCMIGTRVPRVFLKSGKTMDILNYIYSETN